MCYNCFELLKKREFCFTEQIINIDRMENAVALFGSFDGNIKLIEKEFNVRECVAVMFFCAAKKAKY